MAEARPNKAEGGGDDPERSCAAGTARCGPGPRIFSSARSARTAGMARSLTFLFAFHVSSNHTS